MSRWAGPRGRRLRADDHDRGPHGLGSTGPAGTLRSEHDLVGCEGAHVVYWVQRARSVPTKGRPSCDRRQPRVLAVRIEADPLARAPTGEDVTTVLEGWTAA